jgi:hypothetical protein
MLADIGLGPAVRITTAIAGTLALVAMAVQWHLSHEPTGEPEISRDHVALAMRACRGRRVALLRASRCGSLICALCGDPNSRVVSSRLELVVP